MTQQTAPDQEARCDARLYDGTTCRRPASATGWNTTTLMATARCGRHLDGLATDAAEVLLSIPADERRLYPDLLDAVEASQPPASTLTVVATTRDAAVAESIRIADERGWDTSRLGEPVKTPTYSSAGPMQGTARAWLWKVPVAPAPALDPVNEQTISDQPAAQAAPYRVYVAVDAMQGGTWERLLSSLDADNPYSAVLCADEQEALEIAGAAGQAMDDYPVDQAAASQYDSIEGVRPPRPDRTALVTAAREALDEIDATWMVPSYLADPLRALLDDLGAYDDEAQRRQEARVE